MRRYAIQVFAMVVITFGMASPDSHASTTCEVPTLGPPAVVPLGFNVQPSDLATADFNGDGHLDLAVSVGTDGGFFFVVFPGTATGAFGPAINVPVPPDITVKV